jgi:exonuclease VII large subunit
LLASLPTRRSREQLRTAILCGASCLLAAQAAHGQRSRDPLTPNQEEQVRAVADQPNERVKLYIKFIEERTDAIHHAVLHPATQHPGAAIHDNVEDFTRLMDELQDNLDSYDESHSDVRKSLKLLQEHTPKWTAVLEEPPGSPDYDFARKSALDAVDNTKQAATTLLKSQEEYFSKHKADKEMKKKADE